MPASAAVVRVVVGKPSCRLSLLYLHGSIVHQLAATASCFKQPPFRRCNSCRGREKMFECGRCGVEKPREEFSQQIASTPSSFKGVKKRRCNACRDEHEASVRASLKGAEVDDSSI